jgi:hypothetical protein
MNVKAMSGSCHEIVISSGAPDWTVATTKAVESAGE